MKPSSFLFGMALGLSLALAGPGLSVAQEGLPVDLELVLAVDVSGSVDEEEAKLQRDGYAEAVKSREVLIAIRGGRHRRIAAVYIEWAGSIHQTTVVDWTLVSDAASARAFSGKIAEAPLSRGRYTSISGAIEYAMPFFGKNAFDGRRVIDVSGDGANNNGRIVTLARDQAVAAGITINGLPIANNRPNRFGMPIPDLDLYYRKCVIGGPRAFMIVAENFRSFARAIRRKLVLEIAGAVPEEDRRRRAVLAAARRAAPARRLAPPCDIGERRRRDRFRDQSNY